MTRLEKVNLALALRRKATPIAKSPSPDPTPAAPPKPKRKPITYPGGDIRKRPNYMSIAKTETSHFPSKGLFHPQNKASPLPTQKIFPKSERRTPHFPTSNQTTSTQETLLTETEEEDLRQRDPDLDPIHVGDWYEHCEEENKSTWLSPSNDYKTHAIFPTPVPLTSSRVPDKEINLLDEED